MCKAAKISLDSVSHVCESILVVRNQRQLEDEIVRRIYAGILVWVLAMLAAGCSENGMQATVGPSPLVNHGVFEPARNIVWSTQSALPAVTVNTSAARQAAFEFVPEWFNRKVTAQFFRQQDNIWIPATPATGVRDANETNYSVVFANAGRYKGVFTREDDSPDVETVYWEFDDGQDRGGAVPVPETPAPPAEEIPELPNPCAQGQTVIWGADNVVWGDTFNPCGPPVEEPPSVDPCSHANLIIWGETYCKKPEKKPKKGKGKHG